MVWLARIGNSHTTGEIQFSQKSLTHRETTPYPYTTSPYATNPNIILLVLKAPARKAEWPWSGVIGKRN